MSGKETRYQRWIDMIAHDHPNWSADEFRAAVENRWGLFDHFGKLKNPLTVSLITKVVIAKVIHVHDKELQDQEGAEGSRRQG